MVKMTELKECMGRVFIDGAFEFAVPEVCTSQMSAFKISFGCFLSLRKLQGLAVTVQIHLKLFSLTSLIFMLCFVLESVVNRSN